MFPLSLPISISVHQSFPLLPRAPLLAWAPWPTPLLALMCLIDRQLPSAQRRPVEPVDGRLGLGRVEHLDEAEAPRPASVSIGVDLDARDLSVRVKALREFFFRGPPIQIADENPHGHFLRSTSITCPVWSIVPLHHQGGDRQQQRGLDRHRASLRHAD